MSFGTVTAGPSANLAGVTKEGPREGCESLAIPKANLVDFSFGDSNHCRLCRAIVVVEVVLQPQGHFLVVGAIVEPEDMSREYQEPLSS